MAKIKVGDVVKLRGGGPAMTVERVGVELALATSTRGSMDPPNGQRVDAVCVWFRQTGVVAAGDRRSCVIWDGPYREIFPVDDLVPAGAGE